jgi:hypothetical protein
MAGCGRAAILAFFGVDPKKVPLCAGSPAQKVAGVCGESSQVELKTELRDFTFLGGECRDEVRPDFFGAHPKKLPLF